MTSRDIHSRVVRDEFIHQDELKTRKSMRGLGTCIQSTISNALPAVYMEKQNEEFWTAYRTIMTEIDNRPDTRPLFHALLNLALVIMKEEDQ